MLGGIEPPGRLVLTVCPTLFSFLGARTPDEAKTKTPAAGLGSAGVFVFGGGRGFGEQPLERDARDQPTATKAKGWNLAELPARMPDFCDPQPPGDILDPQHVGTLTLSGD